MNRELKFRTWIPNTGWLAEGFSIAMDGTEWYDDDGHSWPISDLEIMQFVGLKDKNGKEIYESDIVKIHAGHPDHLNVVFVVIFETGAFQLLRNNDASGAPVAFITYAMQYNKHNRWSLNEPEDIGQFCEVLGNIYENPELLNQKL